MTPWRPIGKRASTTKTPRLSLLPQVVYEQASARTWLGLLSWPTAKQYIRGWAVKPVEEGNSITNLHRKYLEGSQSDYAEHILPPLQQLVDGSKLMYEEQLQGSMPKFVALIGTLQKEAAP